jgi:hypothetical protein
MTPKTKWIALLLLAGTLVGLMLLAASLSNLEFQPGTPLPANRGGDDSARPVPVMPLVQSFRLPMMRGLFAVIFLILLVFVLSRLVWLANKKMILRVILALLALFVVVSLLPSMPAGQAPSFPNQSPERTALPSNSPAVPLDDPPSIFIPLVVIGLLLGLAVLIVIIFRQWHNSARDENLFLQQAENAAQALKSGADLKNVIMRCYFEMSASIQKEQGLERSEEMTPREFKACLDEKGFPQNPVRQLTDLFEKVRYSQQAASQADEQLAMESLTAIIGHISFREDQACA